MHNTIPPADADLLFGSSGNGDTRPTLLVPGEHRDERGNLHEIGNHEFSEKFFSVIPVGAMYRMDFVVGEIVGRRGRKKFRAIKNHRMRAIVDRHVKLAKWKSLKRKPPIVQFLACNVDLADLLLAQAAVSIAIPTLRALTNYPVYVGDFELAKPGWNQEHGVFYDEPKDLVGVEPSAAPTLNAFVDLVVDFPFADEASRENVLGGMFTEILRPAIDGNVPFHGVMATLERTGKGKLIDAAFGRAVVGRPIATLQAGSKEEEREKRITALVLEGTSTVHFDNIPNHEVLDSPALASFATTREWKGRLLGKSEAPELTNNLVIFLSGNNIRPSGEIAKRIVPIFLQPLDDHPEDRKGFIHPDIDSYATQQRKVVLAMLLGFVERWKAAGRPGCDLRMGGFEKWVQVVGGIITLAGAKCWMQNFRSWVRNADEFTADAETLIDEWLRRHGDAWIAAKQILDIVVDLEIFPLVLGAKNGGRLVVLARRVLTPLTNRPVKDWLVERLGSGGSSRYRLKRAQPTQKAPNE